jgi:hypothetical protein
MRYEIFSAVKKKSIDKSLRASTAEGEGGIAFVHDLSTGIPSSMLGADLIYTELPWTTGWGKFAEWAGKKQSKDYGGFLSGLGMDIAASGVDAALLTGRHAIKMLNPEYVKTGVRLFNDNKCVLAIWGLRVLSILQHSANDSESIISELSKHYDTVADPCCGLGRVGRIFAENGKRFIMSDINDYCIGNMKEQHWFNGKAR